MAGHRARLTRRTIDRVYPHQVEIAIPEGGLGEVLNAMHGWCLANAPDYHIRSAGTFPREATRFCFRGAAAARGFAEAFADQKPIQSPTEASE